MMSDKMALMKISFDKIKLTIGSFATQYDQVGSYYYYTSENILFWIQCIFLWSLFTWATALSWASLPTQNIALAGQDVNPLSKPNEEIDACF